MNALTWNRIRYSLYAPLYDRVIAVFDTPRQRSLELLNLTAEDRTLIVGCGSGRDFLFMPPGVEIVAGDITPAMVRRADARAQRLRVKARVSVMDAQATGYPPASFDSVVLHLILAVVPNPIAAIKEAARVLKPGGKIAIFDKFAAADRAPSTVRRGLNLFTSILFTEINRVVEPMLADAGLRIAHDEEVLRGGFFRIIIAEKMRQ